MVPFAVLDILSDDWLRSRQDSYRPFGTRQSRLVDLFGAVKARLGQRKSRGSIHPSHPAQRPV